MPEQAATPSRQFRLPLLFCFTGLVAVALAGGRLTIAVRDIDSWSGGPLADWLVWSLWVVPPAVGAIVLLLGRNAAIWPMALGLLLAAGLACCTDVGIYLSAPGLMFGAAAGFLALLWQRITVGRIVLSIVTWFYAGVYATLLVLAVFDWRN